MSLAADAPASYPSYRMPEHGDTSQQVAHIVSKYPHNTTVDKVKPPAKRGIPQTACHMFVLYTWSPPRVVLMRRRMLITVAPNIKYRYAPHNDVSSNDELHIRRWSHNIIISQYNIIILTIVLQLPTVFSTVTCCTGL